jgi:hypothetical protein
LLHLGDTVQEITTGRIGKIDSTQAEGVVGQEQIPNQWRVFFSDGKVPLVQHFNDEKDLRLLKCPHSDPEPGFVPERGIMQ